MPYGRRAWALSLRMAYATPTESVFDLELDPYRIGLGGMLSYTFSSGLWLGLSGEAYPGGTVTQIYEPRLIPRQVRLNAESQVSSFDAMIGYDLALAPVVLRYSLGIGVTFLSWDFGDLPYGSLAGFTAMQGSVTGLHLKPSLGVVMPVRAWFSAFDVGYRIETHDQIPPTATFELSMGVRL
ncbi:MAG TPA: hypothetical protein VLC09_21295 [Polyangiaceae bacterium]|nr:hypothetical protein [Polyangiaceae bacterium]